MSNRELIEAVTNGDLESVKKLIKQKESFDPTNITMAYSCVMKAVRQRCNIVKKLIEKGADIDMPVNDGRPLLIYAAAIGKKEIVRFFSQTGLDAETGLYGETALIDVIRNLKEVDSSKADVKDEYGRTPAMEASLWLDVVKTLIEAGADINAKNLYGHTALMDAVIYGLSDVINLLIEAGAKDDNNLLLRCAACGGHMELVHLFLDKGADINAKKDNGVTALMCAAQGGNPEIVRLFLDKGADVNAKDRLGNTALTAAIEGCAFRDMAGDLAKIVGMLIKAGADVNAKDENGITALMYATEFNLPATADLLIAAGANVNAKDKCGHTALMLASSNSRCERVKALIKAGADVNAKDNNGKTALDSAREDGRDDIIELLKQAMK